ADQIQQSGIDACRFTKSVLLSHDPDCQVVGGEGELGVEDWGSTRTFFAGPPTPNPQPPTNEEPRMLRAYAKSQYEEMQVQTTPERLVVMLYDGALRFLQIGLEALRRSDYETQGLNIGKAQSIICELMNTLDPRAGDVASQLAAIYRHWLSRLLVANAEDRA